MFAASAHQADTILSRAISNGQMRAAVLFLRIGKHVHHQAFGDARSLDVSFLLGSITKPIAIAALMTLFDQGKFGLDDLVQQYLPEFLGDQKDRVTIRHLLTHVSGLPDQLPDNADLRRSHAPLTEFVNGAVQVPLRFEPGSKYEYSSMAILLASEIAQRISGIEFKEFVDKVVLMPLGMVHSVFGTGHLKPDEMMPCQVEFGAIESGGGSADAKSWDWNSSYWRNLGAPWGGAQASAKDVANFLEEFLHPTGKMFRPEVAKLMIQNHNPAGLVPRGLGLDVGMNDIFPGGSIKIFGHTGSTGTIAWADPERDCVCVVLTTLPADVVQEHPRQRVSQCVFTV